MAKEEEPLEDEPTEDENGHDPERDEGELATYLEERIKPGLNRGAIPLLARSIAREIARDQYHRDEDDEEEGEEDEGDTDLESDLHKLQEQLGEDWVLSFSVHGGESWLTAEKEDVSQRIEAQDPSVLTKAVKLLNEGGGRASSRAEDKSN